MNEIRPVAFWEFCLLLSAAQERHRQKSEPIPDMSYENAEKIKSCLSSPFQTFGGSYLNKGFTSKAISLFYSLIKGHALINGNKRMAILCLVYFARKNGRFVRFKEDKIYNFSRLIAQSRSEKEAKKMIAQVLKKELIYFRRIGLHNMLKRRRRYSKIFLCRPIRKVIAMNKKY